MTDVDDTSARIHDWVTQTFPLAQERQLGQGDSLWDNGIIDSLGTLEIIQFLEEQFGVQVTDEEMMADHFESIQAIANFVLAKRRDQSADAKTR